MKFKFSKMHGLGNDFLVIDGVRQSIKLSSQQISNLSNRHTGVGFDQCLVVEPSKMEGVDFFYRIYNANGEEVGQCGNGARCLARFVHHHGLTDKKTISVMTKTTKMQLSIQDDDTVTVNMGKPKLSPESIPILMQEQKESYPVLLDTNEECNVHAINVGNPHVILLMDNPTDNDVDTIGKNISNHPLFPQQTNVGFMSIVDLNHIKLRVYERGCGETMACGSGACAAAASARLYHNLDAEITVTQPGGNLKVVWPDINESIYLNGPAVFVYEGYLED
jgi:diaminopimelate epimerase